jgi:hypothetical protein
MKCAANQELSLGSRLFLQVAYPPFGFLACCDDVRHVGNTRFLAQPFQLGFLGFGDFSHLGIRHLGILGFLWMETLTALQFPPPETQTYP